MDEKEIERVLVQCFHAHAVAYGSAMARMSEDTAQAERSVLKVLIDVASKLGLLELESRLFSEYLELMGKYDPEY